MKLLKQYWIIIVASVGVLVLIDIIIRVWFFNRYSLGWGNQNAALFNNIATPVATIISGFLLYLALTQTNKQNKVIMSQNIKPFYLDKFNRINKNFEDVGNFPNSLIIKNPTTSRNLIDLLHKAYFSLMGIQDFQTLRINHLNGQTFLPDQFTGGAIRDGVQFINNTLVSALVDHERVRRFIIEINDEPNLIQQDKLILKKMIKEQLVGEYISFFDSNDSDTSVYLVPFIHSPNQQGRISFGQIHRHPNFRKYYDFFKEELG